jgi:hypothetical protein
LLPRRGNDETGPESQAEGSRNEAAHHERVDYHFRPKKMQSVRMSYGRE